MTLACFRAFCPEIQNEFKLTGKSVKRKNCWTLGTKPRLIYSYNNDCVNKKLCQIHPNYTAKYDIKKPSTHSQDFQGIQGMHKQKERLFCPTFRKYLQFKQKYRQIHIFWYLKSNEPKIILPGSMESNIFSTCLKTSSTLPSALT